MRTFKMSFFAAEMMGSGLTLKLALPRGLMQSARHNASILDLPPSPHSLLLLDKKSILVVGMLRRHKRYVLLRMPTTQ